MRISRRWAPVIVATLSSACSSEPADLATLDIQLVDYMRDDAPMPDVPCTFEKPGGERVDERTDAEGRLHFVDLDWSRGTASIVCLTDDAYAIVELGEDDVFDGSFLMFATVEEPTAASEVTVSGEVTNRSSTSSTLGVQSTHGVGRSDETGESFSLPVLRDEPFDLFLFEYLWHEPAAHTTNREIFGWTLEHSGGLGRDGTIDLDLAKPAELVTRTAEIGLPADEDGVFAGPSAFGDAVVVRRDNLDVVVGLATRAELMGGTLSCEVQFLDSLSSSDEVYTRYDLSTDTTDDRARAGVLVEGYPGLTSAPPFLDVPTVMTPTSARPYEDSVVEWSPDGEPPTTINVCDEDDHCLFVLWPAGLSSVRLPRPPGELWNPGEELTGYVFARDGRTIDGSYFRRVSRARPLTFTQ